MALRLNQALAMPYVINHIELQVTASIGIGMYPNAGTSTEELLRHADMAMYHAKSKGKNTFQFYTAELNKKNQRIISIENQLRQAIDKEELTVVYQPLCHMPTNMPFGVEALLRWNSSELGPVSPEEFIPIVESAGLMNEIGNWVMEQSLISLSKWHQTYPDLSLCVNVNCSISQFQNKRLLHHLTNLIDHYHIDARKITVEATETVLMERVDVVYDMLTKMSDMGVRIAIDDFGVGYSSLSYLKKLPISIVKIDKSFVADIPEDPNDIAIVKAIIQLSETMGIEVIAEGGESKAQADCLIKQGCVLAQGNYFSPPLSLADMNMLLAKK